MLNLGVCIVLRVLDQVQEFYVLTQLYYNSFFSILLKLSATCFHLKR
jgi:hypothetical protein